jgi:transposase
VSTQIDLNELKGLYNEGKTQEEVAKHFGIHRTTIQNFMYRNNLKIRDAKFKKGNKSWNEGLTKKEILSHFKNRKFWQTGLTKEIDERVYLNGLHGSETKKKLFREGKIKIWCEGLTKENDKRIQKIAKKTSKTRKKLLKDGILKLPHEKSKNPSNAQKILFLIIKKYFPTAVMNQTLKTNKTRRYPDIAISELKLDIEYDGFKEHHTKKGIKNDRKRDQELLEVGWKTIRFIKKELKNPETIIERLDNFIKQNYKFEKIQNIHINKRGDNDSTCTRICGFNDFLCSSCFLSHVGNILETGRLQLDISPFRGVI